MTIPSTFGRKVSYFEIGKNGFLVNKKILPSFGYGEFPDGLSLDSEGYFWVTSIFYNFFERFWEQKGCPKGGILGAKMEPESMPKRGRNSRKKKLPLKSDLGQFWLVSGDAREAFLLIFCWRG